MIFSLNLEPIAKATLQQLADKLELQTDLEIELQGTQLTICDDLQQTFLLNFHSPTNQLWLSSPLTGAHHFILNNGAWISTRSQTSLTEILSSDICQLFKDSVNL